MPAIPVLKKKLKSIKATQKLSKALKTVSMAKFAKLTSSWKNYSGYAEQYKFLFSADSTEQDCETVIVLGSNRGFCGGYNNEILNFYKENLTGKPVNLIACGDEIITQLSENGILPDHTFTFGDIPLFEECTPLFELLKNLAADKNDYCVKIIYNHYKNTLVQVPQADILILNPTKEMGLADDILWIPDRESVLENLLEKSFHTTVFSAVLETALGAQAATLMTMRSAYDTATQYSGTLENEIQRMRQNKVTSDVIETRGAQQ